METMHKLEIDWNQAWKNAQTNKTRRRKDAAYWDKRAPSFGKHTKETGYAADFLRVLKPSPLWSVLDVGCATGTLAIPLAREVRSITAIDISDSMLDLLRERCREEGISNITPLKLSWEEGWEAAGIGLHDVAIASRSLVVDDLKAALEKLNRHARKKVIVSALVEDGPFDRRIFEAVGRELDRGPDYIYVYNLLNQMGIYADITFVLNSSGGKVYGDIEDAVNSHRWMVDEITNEEEERLRNYLAKHLVKRWNGWTLSYHHTVRWAVIWWSRQ